LLSNLPFRRTVYLRPAELHALGDGALETCLYPLANHRPLEFSKGAGYSIASSERLKRYSIANFRQTLTDWSEDTRGAAINRRQELVPIAGIDCSE
jgi:hypothetical protein